jgi:hypothetical protein
MEIEIFTIENGYGYKVGCVYQEYAPDLEGFISMTEELANQCALIIKARLEEQCF